MQTSRTEETQLRERQAGFTLLELLVVVSILAVLASITVLKVRPRGGEEIANAALMDGLSLFRETRARAMTARTEQMVFIDLRRRRFTSTATNRSVELPRGEEFVVGASDVARYREGVLVIRFFPDGGSSGGAVSLRYGEHDKRLRVQWLTGMATIDDGN